MAALFSQKTSDDDLQFMSEVDAAMRYRGSRWAYILSILLLSFFAGFLWWADENERKEVTRGTGYIIPSSGVQPIQSEEGGIIKELLVREGEIVSAGTLLGIIANEKAINDFQELSNRKMEFELGLIRLQAEMTGNIPFYSEEQRALYPQTVADQMRLFDTRRARYDSEGIELEAVLEQRKAELKQAELRRVLYESILEILYKKKKNVEPLVPHIFSEKDFNDLKYAIATRENEVKKAAVDIARLTSAVHEAEERLRNRDAERQAAIAKEMNDYRQELNTILERLKAGSDLVQRAELRSPVHGTVKRILLKEEAVVRPAELIMEVLPTGEDLEVLAKFTPQVRGYLTVGQKATVRVSAYDSTMYGSLDAVITLISPDTIEDSKGEPWYEVRLRTSSNKLVYKTSSWFGPSKTEELEIKTGMTVEIDVLSGTKSLLAYLVKPLFKSQQEGKAVGTEAKPEEAVTQESVPSVD